jgi:hypothetical protein
VTYADLVKQSLAEIGSYAQGQVVGAADMQFCIQKLNRIIDSWNAKRRLIYSKDFTNYILIPNHQPHTIGPTGDFVVTSRPIQILNASIILQGTSPAVRSPLTLRDDDWWAGNLVQTLTSGLPTDLYYNTSFSNGQLFLWPISTVANGIQLETLFILTQVTQLQTVNLPPGYNDALTLTLAENLTESFGKALSPSLKSLAQNARATIVVPNLAAPRIGTWDSGMPDDNRNRPYFNWLTGSPR